MITMIFSTILILSGVIYLWNTRKNQASPISITLITVINLCVIGTLGFYENPEFKEILSNKPLVLSKILALLTVVFSWIILKKNWLMLSWVALVLPFVFFLIPEASENESHNAFAYVQVVGIGVVLPLLVHFLTVFLSNLAPPRETAFNTHKQLISLLLGLSFVGFSVLMANFILGPQSIYFLALGMFMSALLFRGYNLNGQKHFPAFVFMLLSVFLFSNLHAIYREEMSMGMYQLISGLIFGASALFVSAFCSQWAAESDGFFSKIIFTKSIFAPVVFILFSGLLFFVYEAFGGRLSLVASLLGAALSLPFLNQIFENRSYGGLSIILGASLLLIPIIQHDRQGTEITLQEDQIEYELTKLKYTNEQGEIIETTLNDLSAYPGKWMLDSSNSIVEFKVHGNESVTDGFFKGISGVLIIDEDYTQTYLDIEIPVVSISTFNKTRDKNIRKDDIFFDEAKFPKMQYEVKNIRVENDQYVANGTFTMKSISLPVQVELKLSGAGTIDGKEVLILEGSGALNRTKFGQTSDPSIGDEITFTFKTIFTIE